MKEIGRIGVAFYRRDTKIVYAVIEHVTGAGHLPEPGVASPEGNHEDAFVRLDFRHDRGAGTGENQHRRDRNLHAAAGQQMLGHVMDYYRTTFGRSGWDGSGSTPSLKIQGNLQNAFADSEKHECIAYSACRIEKPVVHKRILAG